MFTSYVDIFRRHARPLEPIATGQTPVLRPLPGVRAVLFDLYGTLLVSGSGEVGTVAAPSDVALAEALAALGIRPRGPLDQGVACLFDTIAAMHADARAAGRDYPEVDVVEVWRRVLAELGRRGVIDLPVGESVDFARLAVEYEARANPCWLMPGLGECLEALRGRGLRLGLVSNAQFYTPALFEALLGGPPEEFGFDPRLQYYSYQYGWGKPSPKLFELAAAALELRGVVPGEVVCMGNDVLNDILPARQVGFRTALFAGDARSLRLRQGDPRVEGIAADVILTELGQIVECILT